MNAENKNIKYKKKFYFTLNQLAETRPSIDIIKKKNYTDVNFNT